MEPRLYDLILFIEALIKVVVVILGGDVYGGMMSGMVGDVTYILLVKIKFVIVRVSYLLSFLSIDKGMRSFYIFIVINLCNSINFIDFRLTIL